MKFAKAILVSLALGWVLDILIGSLISDRFLKVLLVVMASVLLVGAVLVVFGTATKNRWGINLDPVSCPSCGSPAPQVRLPKSLRQVLWGGWTCDKCGCEMDKWGRIITLAN